MVHTEFISIVDTIRNRVTMEDFEVMAVVARNILFRRNFLVHMGDFDHLNHLVWTKIDSTHEFKEAQVKPSKICEDGPLVLHRWKAPIIGLVKVN